jgi:hypothetical protein
LKNLNDPEVPDLVKALKVPDPVVSSVVIDVDVFGLEKVENGFELWSNSSDYEDAPHGGNSRLR